MAEGEIKVLGFGFGKKRERFMSVVHAGGKIELS